METRGPVDFWNYGRLGAYIQGSIVQIRPCPSSLPIVSMSDIRGGARGSVFILLIPKGVYMTNPSLQPYVLPRYALGGHMYAYVCLL